MLQTLLDTVEVPVNKAVLGLPSGPLRSTEGESKMHQFRAREC